MNIKNIFNFWKKPEESESNILERMDQILNKHQKNIEKKFKSELNDTINGVDNLGKLLLKDLEAHDMKNTDIKQVKIPENKFNILITDDNKGALDLLAMDINAVLGLPSIIELNDDECIAKSKIIQNELIDVISKLNIIKIDGNDSPYRIIKTINNISPRRINIDIAIIDIVFGGILHNNGKTILQDGIDIADSLLNNNENIPIAFYTGCQLNEKSDELLRIKQLEKKYNTKFIIIDKTINDEIRMSNLLELFGRYIELQKKRILELAQIKKSRIKIPTSSKKSSSLDIPNSMVFKNVF